jgi:hypothetical protein
LRDDSERRRSAAYRRFVKRSGKIYRGYLLTAALMLLCGLAMRALHIHTAVLTYTDAQLFLLRPLQTLLDIATLRRQLDLAAVLPMYIGFALCVPLVAPAVRRRPATALMASLTLWLCAPSLAHLLPSADPIGWSFDPFAWQLMFMFGMLCRLHPVSAVFQASRAGLRLTWIALAVARTFAAYKLLIENQPEPGYLKQHLSSLRVVSFVSIAWLVAQLSRLGWIDRLAAALPPNGHGRSPGTDVFCLGNARFGRGARFSYTHASGWRGAIGRLVDDRSGARRRHR